MKNGTASQTRPRRNGSDNLILSSRVYKQRPTDTTYFSKSTQNESASRPSDSGGNALQRNIVKVSSFASLPHNWNYNGAEKISQDVIQNATELLKHLRIQPQIFPTGRNSIQFEYEKKDGDYLEFEIYADKIVCYFEFEKDSKEFKISNNDSANTMVKLFYA